MLMTVEELKTYIATGEPDDVLEARLAAMEAMIRGYTHNRFYAKPLVRIEAFVRGGVFLSDSLIPFEAGDTVQVSSGKDADDCGIYVVKEITDDTTFTVTGDIPDMDNVTVTKVSYGMDVKLGIVNLMKWEQTGGSKPGVASETLSRYSVTYASIDAENAAMGYPEWLLGFLRPYMKARF